jgi:hypothetical protein
MDVRFISRADYLALVETHPERTVFHSPIWLETISEVYGSEVEYLGLFENHVLTGAFPVLVARKFGIKLRGCPLPKHATPRLLPLLPEGDTHGALMAIDAWAKRNRVSHFQLSWKDPAVAPPPGAWVEVRRNLEVELGSTPESVWARIKKKTRSSVRIAARRQGVRLHWVHDERVLSDYARLQESTYLHRQGMDPNFPPELHRRLFERRRELNVRVATATRSGRVVAAVWLLFDNGRCYFWDGAMDYAHRQLSANHLLQWAIMRWCSRKGFRVYDMVGFGGRGGRAGITQFKESFGAQPVEYSVVYWQTRWLRLGLRGYRLAERISQSVKGRLLATHGRPNDQSSPAESRPS